MAHNSVAWNCSYLGGIHSLLAITVSDADLHHTYVIEKAALIRGTGEIDPEQFKNGVHVSHWVDVLPNVENDALCALGEKDIANNTGSDAFCMRTLREICVDLGPYDVGGMNCHHAAIVVYNACAKRSARVAYIPNHFLTNAAWCLGAIGVDVAHSGSGSVQSASVRAQSESFSVAMTSVSVQSNSASVQSVSTTGRESNTHLMEQSLQDLLADANAEVQRQGTTSVAADQSQTQQDAVGSDVVGPTQAAATSTRRPTHERRWGCFRDLFLFLPCVK